MLYLEKIYNKTEFATILTTGRTGSDYLQACLDDVPGVMTFSGHLHFYNFCQEINLSNSEVHNLEETLDLFIKKYYHLFTEDKIENKKINLDIGKFKNNFIEITEKKNLSRQKFLFAVYLAYHLTLNRNIENIKIMVHHSHHVLETKKFLNDFANSKLLVTIRDPRANLKSGITNWIKYDESKHNQQHYFTYIKRIREDLEFAKKQSNKKFFLKLEEANDIKTKEGLKRSLFEFHNYVNRNSNKKIEDISILNKYKHVNVSIAFQYFEKRFFRSYIGTRQFNDWINNALKEVK